MMDEKQTQGNPVKSTGKSTFILKVRKGMYRVVDMDCNPIPPIPCPDPERINETWDWGPKDAGYECYELVIGKWYYFEESGAWTYTELVGEKRMEGLEVMPAPLKYAVPKCRDKGVE